MLEKEIFNLFCFGCVYDFVRFGITFVRNDCKVFRFCRSKCHNNFKLRRNPRRTRWTKAFRFAHGKELTNDNVLNFEKKRNIPIKYDRELMAKTIQAMNRIRQIKNARNKRFYNMRFKNQKRIEKAQKLRVIKNNLHMVIAPVAVKNKQKWKQRAIAHLRKKQRVGKLRLD